MENQRIEHRRCDGTKRNVLGKTHDNRKDQKDKQKGDRLQHQGHSRRYRHALTALKAVIAGEGVTESAAHTRKIGPHIADQQSCDGHRYDSLENKRSNWHH